MLKQVPLLILLSMVIVSCKQSTSPTNTNTTTYVQPKTGSTFTFDEYSTDTTSGLPVPGTRDTAVRTVLQSGMSYMGKTNVSEIVGVSSMGNDTSYINYEANNDISEYGPGPLDTISVWTILPVASKVANTQTTDTTAVFSGVTVETKTSSTYSYVDQETMTVKGVSTNVVKIEWAFNLTVISGGVPVTQTLDEFFYYAPSLGILTKILQPVQVGLFTSGQQQGGVSTLIDYSLK